MTTTFNRRLRFRSARSAVSQGKVASAALLTILLLITGCGSTTSDRTSSLQLPPGTSQAFQLIDFKSHEAIEQRISVYQKSCVAALGFILPATSGGNLLKDTLIYTKNSFGATTEDQARSLGLHLGPLPNTAAVAAPRLSGATQKALTTCYVQALDKLGNFQQLEQQFFDLTNDLQAKVHAQLNQLQDQTDVEIEACVRDQGNPVAPGQAIGDTDTLYGRLFGVDVATSTNDANGEALSYVPLPAEVDLAIAIMNCRVELKVPTRLLDRAKQIEMGVVAEQELQIDELNRKMVEMVGTSAEKLP